MPLGTLRDTRRPRVRRATAAATAGPPANLECTSCGKRYYSAAARFAPERATCGVCLGDLVHASDGGTAA